MPNFVTIRPRRGRHQFVGRHGTVKEPREKAGVARAGMALGKST